MGLEAWRCGRVDRDNAPTTSYWLTVRDYFMITCRLLSERRTVVQRAFMACRRRR